MWNLALETGEANLNSSKILCYRRVSKIKRTTDKTENEEGPKRMRWKGSQRETFSKQKIASYWGFNEGWRTFQWAITQGHVNGKRGDHDSRYVKQIMNDMSCRSYEDIKRTVIKREEWRTDANKSSDLSPKKKNNPIESNPNTMQILETKPPPAVQVFSPDHYICTLMWFVNIIQWVRTL